jgi:UDP-2,3-diacylglucosamine pyrophosphatase LpxH
MRHIDGILYCNDGDWVESQTALVEHMDGRLELVYWAAQSVHDRKQSKLKVAMA